MVPTNVKAVINDLRSQAVSSMDFQAARSLWNRKQNENNRVLEPFHAATANELGEPRSSGLVQRRPTIYIGYETAHSQNFIVSLHLSLLTLTD